MTRLARALAAGLLIAVLASGCSLLEAADEREPAESGERWDASVSMTETGAELAAAAGLDETAPTYDVEAQVDPGTGKVSGVVHASLPVGDADEALFRYFAGVPGFQADASLSEVRVDGEPAQATLDAALVEVRLPDSHDDRVGVTLPFSYTLPMSEGGGSPLDALGGLGAPADIGLLARHADVWNLGHWFPLWIPQAGSADPRPTGFGDIGNSPAALIRLRMTVPEAWAVIDGGVRTEEKVVAGRRTIQSEGYGMNDLVVTLARGFVTEERTLSGALDGVVVRAHGPEESRAELGGVLEETVTSLHVLSDRFVDYPWREFEVISAPLGAGVAGMEWPGATWIEPALFRGGLPGLGGLEDLLGGAEGLKGLDDLLAGLGGGLGGMVGGDTGRMIETMRAWTIAHEVAHEWWHVIVGNDSVLAPVVDEPLAQYSACLVLRALEPGTAAELDALCDTHIKAGYEQMRMLGDEDAPASQPTDDFDSSLQYSGVIYGKAAAFYLALEDRFGREEVADALGTVTEQHAFDMLTADELRGALAVALGDAGFDRQWTRWMEGTHGDVDLGVDTRPGGRSGLEGIEGLDGLGEGPQRRGLEQLLESIPGRLDTT